MSLMERILQARRVDCRNELMAGGLSPDRADRWCDAWELHAASPGEQTGEFWEDGRRWIDAQIAARRSPESSIGRRSG